VKSQKDPTYKFQKSDSNSVIVRLYEALGGRGRATLSSNVYSFASVARCNILEDELLGEEAARLQVTNNNSVTFDITPFKLITLKLTLN